MNPNWQSAMSESSLRNIAIAAGTLYLITHVTSIGAVILYSPILNNANYVLGAGADALVILGAIFDIVLTLAIAGTAVALHPVVKQWGEGVALGYVGLRILEAGIIAVGVVPLLVVVTMRQYVAETAIADPETLMTVSHSLVAFYNETALLGPGLVCGVNTVLMAYLMFKSRLVPRFIPVLGLVGGPVIFAYTVVRMFGHFEQMPDWMAIAVIPIFAWEVSLALWLIGKGFRTTSAASYPVRAASEMRRAV